jgi:hypothetical protein
MVSYTSTLIDASAQRLDRYRRPVSLSPVFGSAKGDLCPLGAGSMAKPTTTSPMSWQHVTTIHNSIVFDGFGFDQVTDDTRLGPPPPRRPSV